MKQKTHKKKLYNLPPAGLDSMPGRYYKFNTRIETTGKFAFTRSGCNNSKVDDELKTSSLHNTQQTIKLMGQMYMTHLQTYTIDDFVPSIDRNIESSITPRMIRSAGFDMLDRAAGIFTDPANPNVSNPLMTGYNAEFIRIIGPKSVTWFYINRSPQDDLLIYTMEFILSRRICMIRRMSSTELAKMDLSETSIRVQPVYAAVGKKTMDGQEFLKSYAEISSSLPGIYNYIQMLNEILNPIIDNIEDINKTPSDVEYSPLEMQGVKAAISYINEYMNDTHSKDNMCIAVESLLGIEATGINHGIVNDLDDLSDVIAIKELLETKQELPLAQFSDREWKFIAKYSREANLIDDDDHTTVINLEPILHEQRYGNALRFVLDDEDENGNDIKTEVLGTYRLDTAKHLLSVIVAYQLSDEEFVYRTAEYVNTDKFNIFKSLIKTELHYSFKITPSLVLPSSTDEIKSKMPYLLHNRYLTSDIVAHILGTFLVIHDRPQRHKVVREEVITERPTRQSKPGKSSVKSNSHEVVVSRLLMPTKDIKKYIETMTRESSGLPRNYVVESWDRAGHWRRLPHSEEKRWIEETTCKRRQPLTDKEVLLKL